MSDTEVNLKRRTFIYRALVAVVAGLWGFLGFYVLGSEGLESFPSLFILMMIGGLISNATHSMTPDPMASRIFSGSLLLPALFLCFQCSSLTASKGPPKKQICPKHFNDLISSGGLTMEPFLKRFRRIANHPKKFSRVLSAFRNDLPDAKSKRKWDNGLKNIFGPIPIPENLVASNWVSTQTAYKLIKMLELYAELKGIALTPEFKKPVEFLTLLEPFALQNPKHLKEAKRKEVIRHFKLFAPVFKEIHETFHANENFSNFTEALRNDLPKDARDEWDKEILAVFGGAKPSEGILARTRSTYAFSNSPKIAQVIEIYARLKGTPISLSESPNPAEYLKVLEHFKPPAELPAVSTVTLKNIKQFFPLISQLQKRYNIYEFLEFVSILRKNLRPAQVKKLDKEIKNIFGEEGPAKSIVRVAVRGYVHQNLDKVIRLLEVYASLKKVDIPPTHFTEKKDYERLFLSIKNK